MGLTGTNLYMLPNRSGLLQIFINCFTKYARLLGYCAV